MRVRHRFDQPVPDPPGTDPAISEPVEYRPISQGIDVWIERAYGGGSSLKRTILHFEFPVAQGKNSEFS